MFTHTVLSYISKEDFEKNPPWRIIKGIKNSVEEFYQQNKVLQIVEE